MEVEGDPDSTGGLICKFLGGMDEATATGACTGDEVAAIGGAGDAGAGAAGAGAAGAADGASLAAGALSAGAMGAGAAAGVDTGTAAG